MGFRALPPASTELRPPNPGGTCVSAGTGQIQVILLLGVSDGRDDVCLSVEKDVNRCPSAGSFQTVSGLI